MIRRAGMDIHAWSFNTNEQYLAYTGPWSDPKEKAVQTKTIWICHLPI